MEVDWPEGKVGLLILAVLPKSNRRTGLFSATLNTDNDSLSQLIHTGLRNPVKVTITVKSDGFANDADNRAARIIPTT